MAKPDISKKNSETFFLWLPQARFFQGKGPKEKSGFAILIASKNQPEKRSPLFFYPLETQKYLKIFLMPFYATGPF
jgi:hypothetical protein